MPGNRAIAYGDDIEYGVYQVVDPREASVEPVGRRRDQEHHGPRRVVVADQQAHDDGAGGDPHAGANRERSR